MRRGGLEPPRVASLPPQGSASASSATSALGEKNESILLISDDLHKGFLMKQIAQWLIRIYQWTIRPLLGTTCRFYPSCSDFASEAMARYGVVYGSWLALKRIIRCHPWHPGGYDPVPEEKD
jgi:uncharacterized protein